MEASANPHRSLKAFKKYVSTKYKQVNRAESYVEQSPHGPSGGIWIEGNIVPTKKSMLNLQAEPDKHARARAIAKTFMDDEPALLGITDPREIKEEKIYTFKGFGGDYTNISYKRFINGIELLGCHIAITIGPDENISGIQANLVPVSSTIYEATKKKTRSEEEIRSIVEADFKANNINSAGKTIMFEKLVMHEPPYVIWRVMSKYSYTLNAFTGEILTKRRTLKTPKPERSKVNPKM
jgi:hypothetical protein